jgi:hypothetical protein
VNSGREWDDIFHLIADRYGRIDIACPTCGPSRRSLLNQRRKTLRIWRDDTDFATFYCARCGAKGYARRDCARTVIDPDKIARLRDEAARRHTDREDEQCRKANWLWRKAKQSHGTIVQTYFRTRGIDCVIPDTLRFLEPNKAEHHPAMIAAFAVPDEPEPGVLRVQDDVVVAVHLTLLKSDGSGKADAETNKIMIGPGRGLPIVLGPVNDIGGLLVCEGIENGLSARQATGLGVWAAGSATRMPGLADAIPMHAECLTIVVDDDPTGRNNAATLAKSARLRGFHVETLENNKMRMAA